MEKSKTVIATATDLHYISPELHHFSSEFLSAMAHEDGKMTILSEELLQALCRKVIALHPDIFVLTGDLSWNGDVRSHMEIAASLEKISKEGIMVSVIPGNHDIGPDRNRFYRSFCRHQEECADSDTFFRIYAPFIQKRSNLTLSFSVSAGNVLAILIDANSSADYGFFPDEELFWLEQQLQKGENSGLIPLVFSHQNFLVHHPFFSSRVIRNADILSLLKQYHVQAGFSGHSHFQHIAAEGAFKDICTASFANFEHHLGIIEITPSEIDYHTESILLNLSSEKTQLTGIHAPEDERTYFIRTFFPGSEKNESERYAAEFTASFFSGRQSTFQHRPHLDDMIRSNASPAYASLLKSVLDDRQDMNRLSISVR